MSRETIGDWIKFTVKVLNIYKKGKDKIRRGDEFVWVPLTDSACRCPKLKVAKTYLLMGSDVISSTRVGVIIDNNSVVLKWTDDISKRLKQAMRSEMTGKKC